jgi:antitoxin VapB
MTTYLADHQDEYLEHKTMQQINVDARIDENGFLSLKMPPNLAGREIKGKLLYQLYPRHFPNIKEKKIDINVVRSICNDIRNLPILDSRTPDEIIGYNEFGIPE